MIKQLPEGGRDTEAPAPPVVESRKLRRKPHRRGPSYKTPANPPALRWDAGSDPICPQMG